MYDHAEAEHQNDLVHVKCDGVCTVQNIENTIIAKIDDQRIDGVVARFAQADEDTIDNGTPRIRNIEGSEFNNNRENLIRIFKMLCITEEWSPSGNCDSPKQNACSGKCPHNSPMGHSHTPAARICSIYYSLICSFGLTR